MKSSADPKKSGHPVVKWPPLQDSRHTIQWVEPGDEHVRSVQNRKRHCDACAIIRDNRMVQHIVTDMSREFTTHGVSHQ